MPGKEHKRMPPLNFAQHYRKIMFIIKYVQEMVQLAMQGNLQGIWFLIAVYACAACGYSLFFQARTRKWHTTRGKLHKLGVEKFGATEWVTSEQDYVSNALYTYEVGGRTYRGTRISPWIFVASHNARAVLRKQLSLLQRYPDGQVKVFYNPKKPHKSYLLQAGFIGMVITLILAAAPLILFYFKYY